MTHGGAATAARRLHEGLLRQGVDSRFYHSSAHAEVDDPTLSRASWPSGDLGTRIARKIRYRWHRQRFRRAVKHSGAGNEIFTSPHAPSTTPWPPANHPVNASNEIVHLHWIAKSLDYETFFGSLSPQQPVVWTLHDMNPFTGGCHFSGGCENYLHGCGTCPQLRLRSTDDMSRQLFASKLQAISATNLHIVAPSRWLYRCAQASPMFRSAKSLSHIPYGISTDQFCPMDRHEARARLGLDPDAFVFCFGAMDVSNRRKGAAQMVQALATIADLPHVQCLVFGDGELPRTLHALPPLRQLGTVSGLLQQRALYSASDVFVLPSLEDNLPLTGLEAMACGTPVVGFASGGIPDYVHHAVTGMLAATGDAYELGRHLRLLAESSDLARNMGAAALRLIQADFNAQREATSYERFYRSLIQTTKLRKTAAA